MFKKFQELGFKVGDRVLCTGVTQESYVIGVTYTLKSSDGDSRIPCIGHGNGYNGDWLLVRDLHKKWCDMSDAEKGALLLAHHNGELIEFKSDNGTWKVLNPVWMGFCYYRVAPEPVTVEHKFYSNNDMNCWYKTKRCDSIRRMKYITVDGVIDSKSIKIKLLKGIK